MKEELEERMKNEKKGNQDEEVKVERESKLDEDAC